MRLIDADALLDILADRLIKVSERYGVDSGVAGAVAGAMRLVEVQPTIEQPHWIPCSDKLPVEGNNVLLSDDLNVTIGRLIYYTDTGYKWEVDYWDCDLEVWQAWMPLPEPARLEGE